MNEDQIKGLIKKTVKEEIDRQKPSFLHQSLIAPRSIKPRSLETVFGSMYAYQTTTAITIAAADTWYEVTSGLTTGDELEGIVFQNSHELKLNYGGKYLIAWTMGLTTAAANQELMGAIGINGTVNTASTGEGTDSTANDSVTVAGNIILDLSEGDLISLFVHNETAATNIVVEHATVSVVRIGQ